MCGNRAKGARQTQNIAGEFLIESEKQPIGVGRHQVEEEID